MDPVSAYILNYLTALQALEAVKARLRHMTTSLALPESERAAAAAAFLDMSDQIGRMESAHAAFKATFQPGVQAPSQALVDRSLQLAKEMGEVISRADTAVAILTAIIGLVDGWTALVSGSPVAAAATGPDGAVRRSNVEWLLAHSNSPAR